MNFEEMSKEELIAYINELNENNNGKYGLVWDKEKELEQIVMDCDKKIPILSEIKENNINNNGTDNILIEGDNFHSLSVLNYTHKESIDVIYIDPPYNTGNKDFMYNDKFVDFEDGYRHSKWLNFMEKRLKLARNLLRDNGLIFISIDDNEQAQLKLLCNQIFGEENFIDTLMVELSITSGMKVGNAKTGGITKNGEFIHIYAKSSAWKNVERTPLYDSVKGYDTHFTAYLDDSGMIKELSKVLAEDKELIEEFKKYNIKSKNGKIGISALANVFDKSDKIHNFVLANIDKIAQPRTETPILPNNLKLENKKWTKYVSKKRNDPYYLSCDEYGNVIRLIPMSVHYQVTDDFNPIYGRTVIRGDYWKEFWRDMVNVYKEGDMPFKNGKKPVRLVQQLLKWSVGTNKNAIILDFFAGSGTTGHAVLNLNKSDNGNRKFILCTNNENNICEKVTYKRLKNVMCGYNDKTALGGNLKYYKTEFVDFTGTRDQLYYDLTEKCIPMLCVKGNTYNKIESNKEYAIFTNNGNTKYSCVYFDIFGLKYDEFIEKIESINGEKLLYIFTLGDYVNTENLKNVDNYTIEPIPYKIVELYKKIVKMSKED